MNRRPDPETRRIMLQLPAVDVAMLRRHQQPGESFTDVCRRLLRAAAAAPAPQRQPAPTAPARC